MTCYSLLLVKYLQNPHSNILSWDTFGYYLYLPMTFIYGDLGMTDISVVHEIVESYNSSSHLYQIHLSGTGNYVIRYPSGWAILNSPFFFIGHVYALFTDHPADGFSAPYQVAIHIGAFFYTAVGLFALRRVLLHFFREQVAAITIGLLVMGTNFFFQATSALNLTHVYLFTLLALIVLATIRWYESPSYHRSVWIAVLVGLSALTRPTCILFILIPMLWNVSCFQGIKQRFRFFRKHWRHVLLIGAVILMLGLIQLSYFKFAAGQWIYYSYANPGEGLDLHRPNLYEVLFGYRKGWLLYTPMMMIALAGLLIHKPTRYFVAALVFAGLHIYVVSSWSCWWYAHGFSQRAMVDAYVIMALGLAGSLAWLFKKKPWVRWTGITIILGLVALNQFQIAQADHGIIHGTRMTEEYYCEVFGDTQHDPSLEHLLLVNRDQVRFVDSTNYERRAIAHMQFEEHQNCYETEHAFEGIGSILFAGEEKQSDRVIVPYNEITEMDHAWIKTRCMVKPLAQASGIDLELVMHMAHGMSYHFRSLRIQSMDTLAVGEWSEVTMEYLTPEVRVESDELQVYLWYHGGDSVLVDDLEVIAYTPLE